MKNKLGEKLKEYRKKNLFTQKEFAEKLGIARSTLADYERGKLKGSRTFLNTLCNATNTPMSMWFTRETSSGIALEEFESLYIFINSLINSGACTIENPLPSEYHEAVLKILELEIKGILNKRLEE